MCTAVGAADGASPVDGKPSADAVSPRSFWLLSWAWHVGGVHRLVPWPPRWPRDVLGGCGRSLQAAGSCEAALHFGHGWDSAGWAESGRGARAGQRAGRGASPHTQEAGHRRVWSRAVMRHSVRDLRHHE
ncbi:hypothetical protein NDU88_006266 [Pleurodeles waltl]|uniref:Uncharacterized protein n=1 Tax=Pleurodeles waltl TaxID=8319 RepID=A0AAV7TX59_PLEWA|nr:hypothetical protein NDU88_006266 [Pleurodeles waltl]